MLKDIIYKCTYSLRKTRRVSFTLKGLKEYNNLTSNSRELLVQLMYRIKTTRGYDGLIIKISHSDHLYLSKRNFQRSKKELIDTEFVYKDSTDYFVNPNKIYYYTPKLTAMLHHLFHPVKNDTKHHFGLK